MTSDQRIAIKRLSREQLLTLYSKELKRIKIWDNNVDYWVKIGKHWYECNTSCLDPNGVSMYAGTQEPYLLGSLVPNHDAHPNLLRFGIIFLLEDKETKKSRKQA